MQVKSPEFWRLRLVTFLLAALAASSVGYWALKWSTSTSTGLTRTTLLEPATRPINSAQIARLLGATPGSGSPTPQVQTKYKLLGVITLGPHRGSALIAMDDKPAKPYRVGEQISEDLVLQSVQARSALLGAHLQGTTSITLELPLMPGTH